MKAKTSTDGPDTVITVFGAERESGKMILKEASEQELVSATFRDGELTLTFRQRTVTSPMPPGSRRAPLPGAVESEKETAFLDEQYCPGKVIPK